MDVSFFENQPFYHKTNFQGENSITQEYLFWLNEDIVWSNPITLFTPISPQNI